MNKIFKTISSSPLGARGSWLKGLLLILAGLFLGWKMSDMRYGSDSGYGK